MAIQFCHGLRPLKTAGPPVATNTDIRDRRRSNPKPRFVRDLRRSDRPVLSAADCLERPFQPHDSVLHNDDLRDLENSSVSQEFPTNSLPYYTTLSAVALGAVNSHPIVLRCPIGLPACPSSTPGLTDQPARSAWPALKERSRRRRFSRARREPTSPFHAVPFADTMGWPKAPWLVDPLTGGCGCRATIKSFAYRGRNDEGRVCGWKQNRADFGGGRSGGGRERVLGFGGRRRSWNRRNSGDR
jgi:hypothetical protein